MKLIEYSFYKRSRRRIVSDVETCVRGTFIVYNNWAYQRKTICYGILDEAYNVYMFLRRLC